MVIGFDGSRAFTADRTGTENYSYQLLKHLAKIDRKNKYVVYVRAAPSGHSERLARRHHEVGSTLGVNLPPSSAIRAWKIATVRYHIGPRNDDNGWPDNFRFKVINWPRLWTQGGLSIQTFKDQLDVLFVPAHTLPVVRKPGLKTVVTVHDLGSEYLPSMHQVKQRAYLGFMQKHQLRTATGIIAVSEATKKDLVQKIGIDPEKITVVYEGYDGEKFKVQNSKLKVNQNIKKYDLTYQNYFLFVGTVQPRKNLERLIKAFSIHLGGERVRWNKAHPRGGITLPLLIIVGSKGWLSDEIYALPKQLGIGDRVKFLGYVPEEDLPALYSGAIALTFPSLFEGFGLPILEAQACGCPVLTSDISSLPEVGGPPAGGSAVYVNPYSVDDIVKGIERVKSQESRVKLIKFGLENVKRFSWEKCARETLEVLEKI